MTVKYWEGKSLEDDTGCKDPDCLCKTDDEKEAPGEYRPILRLKPKAKPIYSERMKQARAKK